MVRPRGCAVALGVVAGGRISAGGYDDIHLKPDELVSKVGQPVELFLSEPPLDRYRLSFDVTE